MSGYYVTWSQQHGAATLPVASAVDDEMVLEDGRRVYDLISTSFQASFGHSHAGIVASIKRQLEEMPIASPKAAFALKERVTERLLARLGLQEGGRLFYTTGGAESVENALKIARQITGRQVVMARRRSYHGASLGAMSVSGDWRSQPHVTFSAGTLWIPEPDADPDLVATEELIDRAGPETIAAVIVETISGTNGVVIPPQSWFDGLAALCRRHGILYIADEILCGFGRTGSDFAFQQFGLQPDLVTMSKAMSGGYVPFGGVWTSPRIVDYYNEQTLACGLTSYAHPLGLAALDAVLDALDEPRLTANRRAQANEMSRFFARQAANSAVREVRWRGMLGAIDLHSPAPSWSVLLENGLYGFSKGNMVIVAPPFVSSPERLSGALETLEQLYAAPAAAVRGG
jgi:taurine--2-oxoglutarate transaminase